MKLNKDQQQKIVLGTMLMFGIIYATNEFLLSPLALERAGIAEEITKAEPQVREMRGQIARTRALAVKGPLATKTIAQVNAMIPDGAPIAWCPPKIAEFFKTNGVEKTTARMNNEAPEKDLAGYRRLMWTIEIPNAEFASLATALSKFENAEPLFEFTGLENQASLDSATAQRATFTVQNIIKL